MKIAVIGSRDYPHLEDVREFIRGLPDHAIVVSGGARGVDLAAELEARRLGMDVKVFYPDKARYGKRAVWVRNREIVDFADQVQAFWDGRSGGTIDALDYAERRGKPWHRRLRMAA